MLRKIFVGILLSVIVVSISPVGASGQFLGGEAEPNVQMEGVSAPPAAVMEATNGNNSGKMLVLNMVNFGLGFGGLAGVGEVFYGGVTMNPRYMMEGSMTITASLVGYAAVSAFMVGQ